MKRGGKERIDDLAAKAFERQVEMVPPGKSEGEPTYRLQPVAARARVARPGAAFALAAAMFAVIVLSPVAVSRGKGGFSRYAQSLTESAEIAVMSRNLGNSLEYLRR